MSFATYPAPHTPLTGAELFMIAQSQNNQLVTCTATIQQVITASTGGGNVSVFGAWFAAWFATLPTSTAGQPAGAFINSGGTLQQVQP